MGKARRRMQMGMPQRIPQQPQQIQVDLKHAQRQTCKACGGKHFQVAMALYRVPAIASPTGQELVANQAVMVCLECKTEFGSDGTE